MVGQGQGQGHANLAEELHGAAGDGLTRVQTNPVDTLQLVNITADDTLNITAGDTFQPVIHYSR